MNNIYGGARFMVLHGRIVKGYRTIYQKDIRDTCGPSSDFRDKLENCLIALCKDADIPTPIWLKNNSAELGMFNKTNFYAEQFPEAIKFDRLEIKIAEK